MVAAKAKPKPRTKPNLQLVHSKPDPKPKAPARWQGEDPVFFHRSQIRVGTKLVNFGRTRHGTEWAVTEILTYHQRGTRMVPEGASQVTKLSDDLVLHRQGSTEVRQIPFSSLSYSSIWRLV